MSQQKEDKVVITVAYDGSQVAREAIELARDHAVAFGADIEVLQAVENGADLEYPEVERREKRLAQEVDQLMPEGKTPYTTVLLVGSGSAGDQVVRRLERSRSKAVCIGIKRRSRVGKLLFGSTAQYIILNAPCPVVTIR
jgi:nucleotide-binding universal stress UspA family protein